MMNVKGLPVKCTECTVNMNCGLRSCRNYKCAYFPQRENVCAAEELSRALERFSIRLDSAFRAKTENELHSLQIDNELLDDSRRIAFNMLHSPDTLKTISSAIAEARTTDEETAARLLNKLLDSVNYDRFYGASQMFTALTGIEIEVSDESAGDLEPDKDNPEESAQYEDVQTEDTPFDSQPQIHGEEEESIE